MNNFRSLKILLGLLIAFGSSLLFFSEGHAIPIGDEFKRDNLEFHRSSEYVPQNEILPPINASLYPNLNTEINEPHPIPEYIKKFDKGGSFPDYYLQLIKTPPVDKVQSKVFDEKAFRKIRRIGVERFENKTTEPFKDETAGDIVAGQISQELETFRDYTIIPPPQMKRDAQIRIVSTPTGERIERLSEPEIAKKAAPGSFPYSSDRMDAVMIGTVTKYMDTYRARDGKIEKSISSGVEFGAFLISAQTGEVIWGARFVGVQNPGVRGFLASSGRWMTKRQLSQAAMKNVLRAFYELHEEPTFESTPTE